MQQPQVVARVTERIERAEWLDQVTRPFHGAALRLLGTGRVRDVLAGTPLGHPSHPALVSAPIGCWTGAFVADLVGERSAARTLTGAGVALVAPVAATGVSDWADTTGAEQRIGFVHLALNLSATAAYAGSWWARRQGRQTRGIVLGAVGAVVATTAAWFGGHLAYGLGVGVDTNSFEGGPTEWTPVAHAGDGPVSRAEADGVALLVTRQPGRTRVLADRCSHRGGPLSDGHVGVDCVTCPWHGSRFDLSTGAVLGGPAVVGQPAYEVRQAGRGLEVRRREPRSLRTNSTRVH
ncbi:MAG: Rieske 2Fe-2S domain-containing protein [Acidimicrobiales bacterium]